MVGLSSDVRLAMFGFALLATLLVVPCLAVADQIRTRLGLPPVLLFGIVLVVLGASAELVFFGTMIGTRGTAVLVWIAAIAGTVQTLRAVARPDFCGQLRLPDTWAPFAVTGAVGFAYLVLIAVAVPGTGSILGSIETWLSLPDDNALPHVLALHIAAHLPPKPFIAEWLSSDRPPLQAGFELLYAALTPFAADSEPRYQALSVLLQTSSLGILYTLCRLCGCRPLRSAGIAALAALSGFFFINSVFVWPKLIAASELGVAVGTSLSRGVLTWRRAVLIGFSTGLCLLCHGAVLFSIPALAIAWLMFERKRSVTPIVVALLASVIVYAPWSWYQNVYDPPGNRLLKWYAAGQVAVTSDSFLHALRHAYLDTSIAAIAEYKLENLAPPLGINSTSLTANQPRVREFFYVRDALSALFIPFVAALFFVRSKRRTLRTASRLAWIALGSIFVWSVALYLPAATVVHQGSYLTMLLMALSGGIVATEWLPLLVPVAIWQIADFATVWLPVVGVGKSGTRDTVYATLILIVVAGSCLTLAWPCLVAEMRRWRRRVAAGEHWQAAVRRYARSRLRGIGTVIAVALVTVIASPQLQRLTIAVPEVASADAAPVVSTPSRTPGVFDVERLAALPRRAELATLSFDAAIIGGRTHNVNGLKSPAVFEVTGNEPIMLAGWAFDPVTRRPAGGVAIRVNRHYVPATYGDMRPDVGTAYSDSALTAVGFHISLDGRSLEGGTNAIAIVTISSDRSSYFVNPTRVLLHKTRP
jgi:hypothetical protein